MDISGLKALSIRQPWCHHILHDGKDVENRSWKTGFRGKVLIHASKTFDGDAESKRNFLECGVSQFGGIVGIMEIVGCVTEMDSRWFCGEYGFVIKNATPIPFIPCKGSLGFFMPDLRGQT